MKFKVFGLVVVLGLSLSGCSTSSLLPAPQGSEDKRACYEVMYLKDLYWENSINGVFYSDELSGKFSELMKRKISPELKSALDSEIKIQDKLKPYEPGLEDDEWQSPKEMFAEVDNFCYSNYKILGW
jgi:hypothetical protein